MTANDAIVNGISNVYDGVSNEIEDRMKSDDQWVSLVKGILRAEMTRRSITYEQLSERLKELGTNDSAVNIRNKVARGGFSASFFVQCLRAIGAKSIDLSDV